MSTTSETGHDGPPLPPSIWWFAWSFIAGQVLELARRGPQSGDAWLPSALLGVVLVTFISHGVLRRRAVRFWLVVVLVGLGAVFGLVEAVDDPSGSTAAHAALSLVQAVLLHRYSRSAWFEHQRQRRPGGTSLAPILAVAALVGALGGVLGADPTGIGPGAEVSYDDPFTDPFTNPW